MMQLTVRITVTEGRFPKDYRKDMVDVDITLDEEATLASFSMTEKANTTYGYKHLLHSFKQGTDMFHILQSIIIGSIRPPDRLKAAAIITCDKCEHPACQGTRDILNMYVGIVTNTFSFDNPSFTL